MKQQDHSLKDLCDNLQDYYDMPCKILSWTVLISRSFARDLLLNKSLNQSHSIMQSVHHINKNNVIFLIDNLGLPKYLRHQNRKCQIWRKKTESIISRYFFLNLQKAVTNDCCTTKFIFFKTNPASCVNNELYWQMFANIGRK